MRACIAAGVLVLSTTTVRAQSPKLVVVAQPATIAVGEEAKRVGAALVGAVARSKRFEPIDVEVKMGGREIGRAAREVATARRDIERGVAAFYELRTDDAVRLLRSAVAAMRKHPARLTNEVPVLARGLSYLAAIQLLDGNDRRGRELIGDALVFAPDLEPDKQVFNPPMRRTFAREKSRLAARVGSISVSSVPRGGLVWIDGVVRGVTPIAVDNLHEGTHVVRVTEDGRRSWGQLVFAVAGATVDVRADLPILKGVDVPRLIRDAFRAADNRVNAPAGAAALGRPLGADQVLLARVRRLDAESVAVDAALYGVAPEVRIARASRELALSRLDQEASALLDMLVPSVQPAEVASQAIDDRLLTPSRPEPEPEPDMLRAPAPTDRDQVLAWTLIGGGAALAIAGVTMAVYGDSVLGDSTSLGEDKDIAVTVGFVGVGIAVVGVAASAWGGWMLSDD